MKRQITMIMCLVMMFVATFANVTPVQAATVTNGSYVKADNENNPLVTQNYGADPGVMVYKDRVYVYTTNDTQEFAGNNENTYGKITQLNCYSSSDMVNWTDHGQFNVAGSNGIAKWASNSWAPHATYKTINGKTKFFLYFANSAGGIGVLTSDSPTGPWTDPIGKALITSRTAGCSGVVWMFDPAVLVDSDGTGYLYFGGGVPTGQYAHPKTARVIKLGADMVSTVGSAATIDAPYLFEDSGINKIGNTYYYSYCSNWNCSNGFNNASIEYMTSSSPMGPFTYKGEVMKNPGVFFQGSTGNNHHCIFEFKGSYYMAYHTRSVESKVIGKSLGYRTAQIDKIDVSNGQIKALTPTMSGVSQTSYLNPYTRVEAETIFTQAGITVTGYGNGAGYVTNIHNGDFTKVKGVNFNNGLKTITAGVRSKGNGSIEVRDGNPSGTLLGTINISNTNGEWKDFSASMKYVSGVKNICFVFRGSFEFDCWRASNTENSGGNGGSTGGSTEGKPVEANLRNTYGAKYGYSGTCINLYQLRDANQLNILKKHYNSITLENEMKPDALLGGSAKLISVSQAKNQGYYIPDNYKESYVPQINFNTVDEVMKICYNNGLKMRAHTLVWHSQTPTWFFRNGYSAGNGFVNASTMDARLEMYIKTVMNHVYLSEYGKDVVYAWDIANEYLHAQNSGWEAVYGKCGTTPAFLQKAFTYASQTLDYFKIRDKVSLFYNDFNTYMGVNDTIKLVNYINSNGKVCDGVGMQSHIGTNFPSVDYYMTALKAFINAGFEVQITEIDITNKGDRDMATYAYNLFKQINALKKTGAKITGVTWWGLSDETTWISNSKPLLFSTPGTPKQSYYKVIQAYTETFGQPTQPTAGKIENGWYYIKNTMSQKYLTVEGNKAAAGTNVCISTRTGVDGQKWYVTNTNDGYITLQSKLGSFMLDVAEGEDKDGANIGIYHAYSGDAQRFLVQKTANNGVYTIATKASKSSKNLDVYEHKTADGTNVCQWSYYGNPNQQWQFEKVSSESAQPSEPSEPSQPTQPTTGKIENGWYYIKNTMSQKYLTVEGNKAAAGTNVCISTRTGVDGQKWYVTNTNDGYITLQSKLGSFMLDVAEGEDKDGANIGIYHAYSGDAQRFLVQKTANNGVYTIATKASKSSKNLDVYEHKTADGTNVCQWRFYGNTNQQWQFEKVSSESAQPTQPSNPIGGMKLDYSINNWGSGYQVSFKVTNKTGAQINTWTLKLKKSDVKIDASWNVNVKTSGDYYVITPVSWNSVIANGGSIEFGVLGSGTIGNTIGYSFQ